MTERAKGTCKECAHAFKRSSFDMKRYGSYQLTYECLKKGDDTAGMYKHASDTCEKWEGKTDG